MTNNPFSIVKATEYSDYQISEYWVPFGDDNGHDQSFYNIMQPTLITPKFVLGSKGCGKTHMLRYYSFECRLNHYCGDVRRLLAEDRYIGFYSRLDGLSSSRFCPSSAIKDPDAWIALYDYFFEIYHGIVALQFFQQIVQKLSVPEMQIKNAISEICIKSGIDIISGGLADMIDYLDHLRLDIDKEIRLFAHTRELRTDRVVAKFNFGTLIFDIPSILSKNIPELNGINIIYILDEYEKLQEEWQKESLNTLVYERRDNVTFWLGARKTGYTTRATKMKENIHDGHEFQSVDLDLLLKKNEGVYSDFARKLFSNRLAIIGHADIVGDDFFEECGEDYLIKALEGKELKHWGHLKEALARVGCSLEGVNNICRGLQFGVESNPIEQKGKLLAFYQRWSEKKDCDEAKLIEIAASVNDDYSMYLQGKNNKYKERVDKFRQDFRAQLAIENKIKIYQHSGFKEIINISDCNPRVFLTLIKLIIDDCIYSGVKLFEKDIKIPLSSQYAGINETARWFLSDVEVYGEDREVLSIAINNLIQILYDHRYCDKPIEPSLCSFYYREVKNLTNTKRIIDIAENEAFLIQIYSPRKDKTLGTPQHTYQLNRLLSTLYNLPIARRGIKPFDADLLRSIFDPEYQADFRKIESKLRKSLNAPFGKECAPEKNVINELTLF